MDTACQENWDEANPGTGFTFRAFAATSTESVQDRIPLDEATWIRVDGSVVAESTAELMSGDWVGWARQRAGGGWSSRRVVYPRDTNQPLALNRTCGDWTGTDNVRTKVANDIGYGWTGQSCPAAGEIAVHCVQDPQ